MKSQNAFLHLSATIVKIANCVHMTNYTWDFPYKPPPKTTVTTIDICFCRM